MKEKKPRNFLADDLSELGSPTGSVQVTLSNELVRLLSEQLYQSPLKAIEELVVNAFDADARECRIYVPDFPVSGSGFIAIYDDGFGMDQAGMENLWQIGRSQKRTDEYQRRVGRKQIGKFGIGKLATYTIAHRLTYLSRASESSEVLGVTINFDSFEEDPTGKGKSLELPVHRIDDLAKLASEKVFIKVAEVSGIDLKALSDLTGSNGSWTIAILEHLKDKASKIKLGRLRWVLRTAMPLRADFRLFLNGEELKSSKEDLDKIVEFSPADLGQRRLESLTEKTGESWEVQDTCLTAASFPSGVCGRILVTERSLHAGKSEDLGRSNGFFIYVRHRLINEDDPLFGMSPRSHQTFNRFRADLDVDDLDEVLTAPREGVEESDKKQTLEALLAAIFAQAREHYQEYLDREESEEKRHKEHERNFVNPRLVEHPIADVLGLPTVAGGAEPDETWFYLQVESDINLEEMIGQLYSPQRDRYEYTYLNRGRSARLVSFEPKSGTFFVNEDHDLVLAHGDDPRSRVLLEDVVTAEALLEVYLRESGLSPHSIGEVLERRDSLLRSLARDHPFSLRAIGTSLRDAATDEHDLEVSLVTAARALGFVAKHISGPGEPDGIARLREYPEGEKKITLEAKSSATAPSLGSLDFAGLAEHKERHEAQGCLLVAPEYPGSTRGEESAAATRARQSGISCWTITDFARVVERAEERQLTAQQVLSIVLNKFAPEEVEAAVAELLERPSWDATALYRGVLRALVSLEGRLPDSPRTVDLVAGEVSREPRFREVRREDIERAVRDLASASQGALTLRDARIRINTSAEELARRLSPLTRYSGTPRRPGRFRNDG